MLPMSTINVIFFLPRYETGPTKPHNPHNPSHHPLTNFFPDRTESENSLYLSYDCEGDQDKTEVRQSSYTCAGSAPATTTATTTTTTTTITTAAADSAISFVEISTDCAHDPGSTCYLQSKIGMDWYQAEEVHTTHIHISNNI